MKTKFMQAFEELDETPVGAPEDISGLMLEQEEDASETSSMQDQVEEAEDTQETLEKMEAAETPEEAVCIAKEHMLSRIGYTAMVGVESFSASNSDFKQKMDRSIKIAQEGILSRIGDAIKFSFTSDAKIADGILKATRVIEEKGSNEKIIKEPGWGWIFDEAGKKELNGDEVIGVVKRYAAIVSSSAFNNVIGGMTDVMDKANEKSNTWFIGSDSAAAEIKKLVVISNGIAKQVDDTINVGSFKEDKKDITLTALTVQQASKLSKQVLEILKYDNLEKIYKAIEKASSDGEKGFNISASLKLKGDESVDSAQAKKVLDDFKQIVEQLNTFVFFKSKLCYAAMQYIKASTK